MRKPVASRSLFAVAALVRHVSLTFKVVSSRSEATSVGRLRVTVNCAVILGITHKVLDEIKYSD